MPGFVAFKMKPATVYSGTAPKSFRLSGVAIEKGNIGKIYFIREKNRFVLATLTKLIPQASLDLKFVQGESLAFEVEGDATITLTGYTELDNIQDSSSEDDDDVYDFDDDDGYDEEDDYDDYFLNEKLGCGCEFDAE